MEVRSDELGVKAQTETPTADAKTPSLQEKLSTEKPDVATASENPSPANATAPNLLDHVKSMVKEHLKTAPGEVAEDLARDGKSAVNTVIKRAMRRYIKDMF